MERNRNLTRTSQERRCYTTVTSNPHVARSSQAGRKISPLQSCDHPGWRAEAYAQVAGESARRKWVVKGLPLVIESTENWQLLILSPVRWPELFTCPYPITGVRGVQPHMFWKSKTRNNWSSALMSAQYAKPKAGIQVEGKDRVWRKRSIWCLQERWPWGGALEPREWSSGVASYLHHNPQ